MIVIRNSKVPFCQFFIRKLLYLQMVRYKNISEILVLRASWLPINRVTSTFQDKKIVVKDFAHLDIFHFWCDHDLKEYMSGNFSGRCSRPVFPGMAWKMDNVWQAPGFAGTVKMKWVKHWPVRCSHSQHRHWHICSKRGNSRQDEILLRKDVSLPVSWLRCDVHQCMCIARLWRTVLGTNGRK